MGRTLKMKVSATNSALKLLSDLQEKYGKKLREVELDKYKKKSKQIYDEKIDY